MTGKMHTTPKGRRRGRCTKQKTTMTTMTGKIKKVSGS
jgi:hypothetical protein